jgi:PKD repeat protein
MKSFLANQNSADSPFTVDFTDFSVHENNSINSWSWDFDNDGVSESTAQNPTWTYNQPGIYTVELTVSDGNQTSTYTKNNCIEVLNPQRNQQVIFHKDFEDQSLTSGG